MSWGFIFGAISAVVFMVIVAAIARNNGPLDDTDNKVTGMRSGMQLMVDHGTGCQYLRTAGGGLTPRLDAQGKPICGRTQ